ncbi:hypothetical protein GCM10009836_51260 [Pseudonocardia ailaonensis]|uniref:Uncharacterized protein n=1 Tax=Pseudonocardia ailaonensis TaxID=367279 RepID=A0ABN2NE16_9PSEU
MRAQGVEDGGIGTHATIIIERPQPASSALTRSCGGIGVSPGVSFTRPNDGVLVARSYLRPM